MFSLSQILSYYPEFSPDRAESCLREYLQYKILKSVFASPQGTSLRFIGGTALRIVYGNTRFSEDIDFDNDGTLSFDDFNLLAEHVQKDLEHEGLEVRMRTIKKGAFHCHISIPSLLYENNLSPMKTQTILIQIDTTSQGYQYAPTSYFLNKFDVQSTILTVSPSLLLSQKIFACFTRKRTKGRDFFDIVFLLGRTQKPDYEFLQQKLGISTPETVKKYLLEKAE
ncbi:MAG: nucleotidyl transferase AbiEii/AbiGii toxin family protein [Candidatus Peribacteria bacterium]|jgi:predicted nucleotidyltransferase component of viral defense system|nr:nucleotidyl transferase AbiEii/AbiGii toxin family protein [Candidatus Peribacteria bacterium]